MAPSPRSDSQAILNHFQQPQQERMGGRPGRGPLSAREGGGDGGLLQAGCLETDGWASGYDDGMFGGLVERWGGFNRLLPCASDSAVFGVNWVRTKGVCRVAASSAHLAPRRFNLGRLTTNLHKLGQKGTLKVSLEGTLKPGPLIVCFKMWKRRRKIRVPV